MKKFEVTIEETVSQTFTVEAESKEEAYHIAEKNYYNCDFVLEPGECTFRKMSIPDEISGDLTEWREF